MECAPQPDSDDPLLAMLGVGRQLWQEESGDQFVDRLRAESPPPNPVRAEPAPARNLAAEVWERISAHQGEPFNTARNLPFTYQVEGNGIWFFREGRRINRKLTRAQTEVAISRCPLLSTTEIKDLIDYPYLYALLIDRRIRSDSW